MMRIAAHGRYLTLLRFQAMTGSLSAQVIMINLIGIFRLCKVLLPLSSRLSRIQRAWRRYHTCTELSLRYVLHKEPDASHIGEQLGFIT